MNLRNFLAFVLLPAVLTALWQPASAAIISTSFGLGGYLKDGTQSNYDLADLKAYASAHPSSVKTVSVPKTGGGTDTYVGISLYDFLDASIKTDPAVPKNDILRDYVVATGTDGYKALYSLGELNPSFGNQQNDIIAYQLNGQDLTSNGFARIVAPNDVKAGRWVSNLSSLEVGHVPNYTAGPGGKSTQFTVDGWVNHASVYDYASLHNGLTPHTVTVNTLPASLQGTTFTGAYLWDLLNQSGILTDPSIKNDILSKYVIATGSDGYQVVFSLGELSPSFGNQGDLLAYDNAAGTPLDLDGFARTVVPGDVRGGRYVSNLVSLEVVNANVPEPATALLLLAGCAGFGIGGKRRRVVVEDVE
jgi:hypothetical protein